MRDERDYRARAIRQTIDGVRANDSFFHNAILRPIYSYVNRESVVIGIERSVLATVFGQTARVALATLAECWAMR